MATAIDWDLIKAEVDITEILSRYVAVPEAHAGVVRMPCPIHGGDNDNFRVKVDEGYWFCFSDCHRGGDVIALYAALEGITQVDAANRLVEEHSLRMSNGNWSREAIATVRNAEAYQRTTEVPVLDSLPDAEDLTECRGYSRSAINHFGLRSVPGNTLGCGVLIPLKDAEGEFVGYTIRQKDEVVAAYKARGAKAFKYMDTKGMPKLQCVFGLYENAEAIKAADCAYVVEGQFDAIRLWDHGIKNVVAVMSSNMQVEQAEQLAKYCTRLVVVFDGDEAGRTGARNLKTKYGLLFRIDIRNIPQGLDPDSLDDEAISKLGDQ